jgi:DNA-binding FadR family transcriptional regulator
MGSAVAPTDASENGAAPGKLAQQTAKKIEAEIVRERWPVGQMLGSETELRERYGVSRAVLREAVRLVEHHQVATMRRGPSGGLFVRTPDPSSTTRAMVIYLEHVETSLEDLLDARILLESLAVTLAVNRLDEQGISRLRAVLTRDEEVRDPEGGMPGDSLHLAIGGLSGNPALELFIDILCRLTERYSQATAGRTRQEHHHSERAARHAHDAIAAAIIDGDAGAAQHNMRGHLEAMGEWLTSQTQLLSYGQGVNDPSRSGDSRGKLAEIVAERVREDIVRRGWIVGEVLGSEAELQARYDVSRSVFREAVRILEHHSVAIARRGPGGGLVIAEPDPTASIESMVLYLDYQQIEIDDLKVLREAVELGCVEQVTERIGEPGVADRLRNSLLVDASTPESEVLERAHTMHIELAELSGNPVLRLFLRILTELWGRHSAALPIQEPAESGPRAPAIESIHGAIVEAILAGDGALAKYRMRRHLEALTEWWRP